MNSSIHPRAQRSFELRDNLKELAAEFSQRREQLARDIARRRREENQGFQAGMDRIEAELAAETARLEAEFANAERRGRERFEARRRRIERIRDSGNANLLDQGRRARERWLGNLQMKHFYATRNLPVALQAEETAAAEFLAALSREEAALADLRARARQAFGDPAAFFRAES
ncbi:MAG TPA: hypothetical protein VIS74_02845, partial [Chthoniobacterales bacterium]